MGGIWEGMISSIRKVLAGLLTGNVKLTDEILETFFTDAESIINGRPSTKVSDDIEDLQAITPNHLLLLREGPVPSGHFVDLIMYRCKWRHVQYLADQFWKRWVKDYLPELQRRGKWVNGRKTLGWEI